jgi:fido (protein-threonine AMPylation protein)
MISVLLIFFLTCYSNFDKTESKNNLQNDNAIKREVDAAINLAIKIQSQGKSHKAAKIYKHVLYLDPKNIEALNFYTNFIKLQEEEFQNKIHYYSIPNESSNNKSLVDPVLLNKIDLLLEKLYNLSIKSKEFETSSQCDSYIYSSNIFNKLKAFNSEKTWPDLIKNLFSKDQQVKFLDDRKKFSFKDLFQIHKDITEPNSKTKAGMFREHQVVVDFYAPPPAYLVRPLMKEFIDWLNQNVYTESALHPLEIASLAHIKLVNIHPFYDGNGRTGRILMNLILTNFGYPPLVIRPETKKHYNECMSQANRGNSLPFINFIAKLMLITLHK